ncbi:hypothetical protein EDC04DRAFT_2887057 [Pisolithus marmoratus]|nr:hypothetical protein EDC04DRAFT_2887057 [Pisolithus marmoratus]
MARFRAPSPSTDSSAFGSMSHAVPNMPPAKKATQKPAKIKKALDGPGRARVHTAKARNAAGTAYKKAQKHANHQHLNWTYVFVGNVGPEVDESALKEHFKNCGDVISAHIRCSGGIAMTVKPRPDYYKNYKVRQYGVVTFSDKKAVRNAILLSGSQLGECEIVVCRSAGDLPEVREKVQQRLDDYRARNGFVDPRSNSARRPLNFEPTILLDHDAAQNEGKKFKIFGFSVPFGIM